MVNIGIIGLGTVGLATYQLIQKNKDSFFQRLGIKLNIKTICAKSDKKRKFDLGDTQFVNDPMLIANDPQIDIVLELMGGLDIAYKVINTCIKNGKHVVTANKDLIARKGNEIFTKAAVNQCLIKLEAAVGGGIPIIKAISDSLIGNDIQWIAGILNGTSNYILTKMMQEGWSYEDALKEAQRLGYSEIDPSFDVDGIDAAHKIAILASIAFHIPFQFKQVYIEPLSKIKIFDVNLAKELGFVFKQVAFTKVESSGVECRVHPALIPKQNLFASVNGVMNAVAVHASAVGSTLYYGPGAGGGATASSVVADVLEIAKIIQLKNKSDFSFKNKDNNLKMLTESEFQSAYYVRLDVLDQVGTLAKITQIFAKNDISIETIIQKPIEQNFIPIVIVTHSILKSQLNAALIEVHRLKTVTSEANVFHILDIDLER